MERGCGLTCLYWLLVGQDHADECSSVAPDAAEQADDGLPQQFQYEAGTSDPQPVDVLLTRLRAIGQDYSDLVHFVNNFGRGSLPQRLDSKIERWNGRYLSAFADAVSIRLIRPYERHLRNIFRCFQPSSSSTLCLPDLVQLCGLVAQFGLQLQDAVSLVQKIEERRPPGTQLIGFVLKNISVDWWCSRDSVLCACVVRMCAVLQTELAAFLTDGRLAAADRHGEFFVRRRFGAAVDYLGPLDRFELRASLLPPFIQLKTADHLLYVGSAAAAIFG